MDEKVLIDENSENDMGKGYKTYAEAIKNCRSNEITVYNSKDGLYHNVKIFPKTREDSWRLGSAW